MSRRPANPPLDAQVIAQLRGRGLRVTEDRLAIWRELAAARDHMDADALYAQLRRKGLKGSRATVYRTLDLFVKADLVSKIRATEQRFLYEIAAGRRHHDHLVCTSCGKIVEFENDEIERLQDQIAARHGFTLAGHVMRLSGLCAECRRG